MSMMIEKRKERHGQVPLTRSIKSAAVRLTTFEFRYDSYESEKLQGVTLSVIFLTDFEIGGVLFRGNSKCNWLLVCPAAVLLSVTYLAGSVGVSCMHSSSNTTEEHVEMNRCRNPYEMFGFLPVPVSLAHIIHPALSSSTRSDLVIAHHSTRKS
jgi:hypothetical protein